MFNLDDCMAFITSKSAKIISQAMEKRLIPYNITRSQWIALYYIYTNDCITQSALAEKMSIKEPTVVRVIQKMEQDGLLIRLHSNDDKRIKQLSLSNKGTRLCEKLLPIADKFMHDTIAGISQQDLQILKNSLDKMTSNVLKNNSQK